VRIADGQPKISNRHANAASFKSNDDNRGSNSANSHSKITNRHLMRTEMHVIQPATTNITAFLRVSAEGPYYEAHLFTEAPPGDSVLTQFFLGGGGSAWIVSVPEADIDVPRALAALDVVPSLNLVAMPALGALAGEPYEQAIAAIATYCGAHRRFFIVDPPADWTSVDAAARGAQGVAAMVKENGAVYWPPLTSGAASGAVAAVYVTTDQTRGVWKAPAGITAALPGAEPAYTLTDAENGVLNPLGVNCIRKFPVYGTVVWGARTTAVSSDWRYLSVRRLALFIETSIIESLQWTASEPNAPALWSDVRESVSHFLTGLWQEGAFAGTTPADSFFVQCDATTTTQDDLENGRVNVVVGFAPVQPAEFIVLKIVLAAAPSTE
jgi:uncharacterized protein